MSNKTMRENPQKSVLVAILNWNGSALTLRCVTHALQQSFSAIQVVVIDNGSREEQLVALRQGLPACRLIELPTNLGFAAGMNIVLRQALAEGYEYVWLLNNDAFPEPDCLAHLVRALAADPRLAAVTPRLTGTDGLEQHAGARVDWDNGGNQPLLSADLAEPIPAGHWLTGAALLLRVDALRRVGLLDQAFFAYWEDVDLCFRLARAGYLLRAVPEAHCLHLGSASSEGGDSAFAQYLEMRNTALFMRKHLRGAPRLRCLLVVASAALNRSRRFARRGKEQQSRAILAGVLAALQNQTGPAGPLDVHPLLRRFLNWQGWRLAWLLSRCAALLTPPALTASRRWNGARA